VRVLIDHPQLVCLAGAALQDNHSAEESPESSVCVKKRSNLETKSYWPIGSVGRASDEFRVTSEVAGASCEFLLITLDSPASMPPRALQERHSSGKPPEILDRLKKRSNLETKSCFPIGSVWAASSRLTRWVPGF
jgi:hypothetical protein